MKPHPDCQTLQRIAWELRLDALRMVFTAKSGHLGGSFSAAELITALYFYKARLDPRNPSWEDRDRIFVSKGHCAPIYYAALSRRGFFPEEELATFRQLGSRLQGHPDRLKLPGVEMSSGPLGLGASAAVGCALGLRLRISQAHVYCLLGDGETQEGIVWEAAMCAAKYRLGNLTFILDSNRYQLSGAVERVMPMEPLEQKWQSFGFKVLRIDGHDIEQIVEALDRDIPDQPGLILALTLKGRGVSFMESSSAWHGRVPSTEEMIQAEEEISRNIEAGKEVAVSGRKS
ncbi:MAG: transketolase [Spirochaetaceae bacterium]|nr:MAG: transketolase [Spirochaetaceae bacterium]